MVRSTPRFAAAIVLLVAVLGVLAAACADDAPAPITPPPAATVPAGGPPPPAVLEILGQVAALRGLPNPPDFKVGTVRREEIPSLLEATLSDADRTWFAQTTTLYRLLGFLAPDESYLDVFRAFAGTAVIGLYYPLNKTLYVVTDGGQPIESLNAPEKQTLAHELTHALQDAAFDLAALANSVQPDLDRQLAFLALVEGDAVTHGQLWTRRSELVPFRAGGGTLLFANARGSFAGTPAAIERELLFPYTTGTEWVQSLRASGGTAAIDRRFRNLPASTAEILHPEQGEMAPVAVALPDIAAVLGAGWHRESGGTLGEFILRNLLQDHVRALDAVNAAAGWAGDHYDVYKNGEESVAALRLRFSSTDDRAEFEAAWESWRAPGGRIPGVRYADIQKTRDGRELSIAPIGETDVILVFARGPGLAARVREALIHA